MELGPELEVELGPGPGPAKQAKRRGFPGKIPFRELSRQWSGEGAVAVPGPTTTEDPLSFRLRTGRKSCCLHEQARKAGPRWPGQRPTRAPVDLNSSLSGHGRWREAEPEPGQLGSFPEVSSPWSHESSVPARPWVLQAGQPLLLALRTGSPKHRLSCVHRTPPKPALLWREYLPHHIYSNKPQSPALSRSRPEFCCGLN